MIRLCAIADAKQLSVLRMKLGNGTGINIVIARLLSSEKRIFPTEFTRLFEVQCS